MCYSGRTEKHGWLPHFVRRRNGSHGRGVRPCSSIRHAQRVCSISTLRSRKVARRRGLTIRSSGPLRWVAVSSYALWQRPLTSSVRPLMLTSEIPRRGQRRFWVTLDNRYEAYYWPASFAVRCPRCRAKARFSPSTTGAWPTFEVADIPLGGKKEGVGTCMSCAHTFTSVEWPRDAYYCSEMHGGSLWAWNAEYLRVLRARVAGDRVLERQLCLHDWRYHYFLTRIPKHIVIKRHRARILRKIDGWLAERS